MLNQVSIHYSHQAIFQLKHYSIFLTLCRIVILIMPICIFNLAKMKVGCRRRHYKEGGFHIDRGVGVRAVSGEKTGFAGADQINLASLQQCAEAVKGIAQVKQGNLISPSAFNVVNPIARYAAINPLESLTKEKKIELLHLVDRTARAEDHRVTRFQQASVPFMKKY